MKRGLRLFVWEDCLCDWTCGVIFALAHDAEEARELVVGKRSRRELQRYREWCAQNPRPECYSLWLALEGEPLVITEPEGWFVMGGS